MGGQTQLCMSDTRVWGYVSLDTPGLVAPRQFGITRSRTRSVLSAAEGEGGRGRVGVRVCPM